MRIFLLNTAKGWGGLESHSIVLARALLGQGHEVVLGCRPAGNVAKAAAESGIQITDITLRNAIDISAVWRMAAFIKSSKMDILVANLGREYWPATLAAKLAGIKIVLIRHQLDPVKKITTWLINTTVDKVVAVTHAVKNVMIESGIRDEKISVVHPGQNLERFQRSADYRHQVRAEWGIHDSEIVIAAAGKLAVGKGIYELLEAVRQVAVRHPNVKLMYIGDGDERENLPRAIQAAGMSEKVIVTGYRSDIDRLFSAIDIFVLPSKGYESFGMVLIEAMAAGKPVIGTNTGGIPEIITHKENGLLTAPGSIGELEQALESLISSRDFCRQLTAAGHRTVEERFTAGASARKFADVIRAL